MTPRERRHEAIERMQFIRKRWPWVKHLFADGRLPA
jgi:hypothetical protein